MKKTIEYFKGCSSWARVSNILSRAPELRFGIGCCAVSVLSIFSSQVLAQAMPDIGFESVGRGAPIADARDYPIVGAFDFAGLRAVATMNGQAPDGIEPLSVDLFTSTDFYRDQNLWMDRRYWRCNSTIAVDAQPNGYGGGTVLIGDNPPASAAWGYCDRDYPRESIVSPYGFSTAEDHYQALLEETRTREGPTQHTYATVPGDISGRYVWNEGGPGGIHGTWYNMAVVQVPTLLSILTPEYQKRVVQEAYHQARGHSNWPSQYCWPEGFMRRWNFASTLAQSHSIIVTPDVFQILAGIARNFLTQIHFGREFDMDGAVPRLGADVPRWYGDTIGFWDGEVAISWTSNIQGWTAHAQFEHSSKMQTVEIYTPIRDPAGNVIALNHETILYDPEALVEPVRIVRNLSKESDLTEGDPYTYIECVQTIFPVDGIGTPLSPGATFEYHVSDMYGRPWAKIWENYHEEDMQRPETEEDIFSFE